MCCLLSVLLFLGPRVTLALWWLVDTPRFSAVFNTFIVPALGFLFLPFTTLVYVLVWNPVSGVSGLSWLWVALALIIDLGSYGGSGYRHRGRIRGTA